MRYPIAFVIALFAASAASAQNSPAFKLTFEKAALDEPFTGRVFVTLTKSEPRPVSRGINWFNPEPTFAIDVKDWKPGTSRTLSTDALAFPKPFMDLPAGKYYVQAIMDRDLGGISVFTSPGNLYSKPKQLELDAKQSFSHELIIDQIVKPAPFHESDSIKLVDIPSKLLTDFHKKPMRLRAGVVLPPSFAKEPDRKYPVVYEITGFGGDHTAAILASAHEAWDLAGTEAIWVVLDANCRLGHHVFADSANNGPCGTALVQELIPHLEKTYRGNGKRLVTGHSSGGWASLWLQVCFPETFLGCWSTSPDPVDFHDFQRVNLYDPESNLFTDEDHELRELSRGAAGRALTFKSFSAMEDVMGRGGQLASFEAVFSPRGDDGKPWHLWNRKTGAIDPATANAWEKYDIRLVLERNWKTLGPKLHGKLHVWCGEADTFYLDGAVKLLRDSQATLGSDAVIELFPKKTHALMDRQLRTRMSEEMAAALKK